MLTWMTSHHSFIPALDWHLKTRKKINVLDFGTGLTSIGINAFYNCDSLIEIALPATVKTLPSSCFAGCIALKTVDLGGVEKVGAEAFRHCSALASVTANQQVEFEKGNDLAKSVFNSK